MGYLDGMPGEGNSFWTRGVEAVGERQPAFSTEKRWGGILLAPGVAADTTRPEWLGSMPAVWELIVGYSSLCRLTDCAVKPPPLGVGDIRRPSLRCRQDRRYQLSGNLWPGSFSSHSQRHGSKLHRSAVHLGHTCGLYNKIPCQACSAPPSCSTGLTC